MAQDSHQVQYQELTIGGQIVSTLHERPRKATHYNTIRADHRSRNNGKATKRYITDSRRRVHEMRDAGNIVPVTERGHMKLSRQARRTMDLVLSEPEITMKKRAKHVNALAGVFRTRPITRDQSILEVASTVTGLAFSSQSLRTPRSVRAVRPSRNSNPTLLQLKDTDTIQGTVVDLLTVGSVQQDSVEPLSESTNDWANEIVNYPQVPEMLALEKATPSKQQPAQRLITRHETEIFYGLVTPGTSPVKAIGNRMICRQDTEIDDTLTDSDDFPDCLPSPGIGSPAPQEIMPQPSALLEEKISILMQEKEILQGRQDYVLRKLSRNGEGTISNIEIVTDRVIRHRDNLRAENKELRAAVERAENESMYLRGEILWTQVKLDKAKAERAEMVQSKVRWIARMWTLAGRLPGELRKKDAEIESTRKALSDLHVRLAREESKLEEVRGKLGEERMKRIDVEAELKDSSATHAQEIKERDLAGLKLKDQLKLVVQSLESGSVAI